MTDAHSLTRKQVIGLFDQIETLREYIRQLEDALVPMSQLPSQWNLSSHQARLLRAIRAAGPSGLSHDSAMLAIYGMIDEAPDDRIIHVFLVHIRRRLAAANVPICIERIPKFGWRMPPESCAVFDAAIASDQRRWPECSRANAASYTRKVA
jgi:hypothetical protein